MANHEGGRIIKQFLCDIWNKRNERLSVGGVSIKSRDGTPSRKGCAVNGPITTARTKRVPPPAIYALPETIPEPSYCR